MEIKKVQIQYNDFIELLKHHYGDIILEELKELEITVVDEDGQTLVKFVLENSK